MRRFPLRPVAAALLCIAPALAMAQGSTGLKLRLQSSLIDLPPDPAERTPTFFDAERIEGNPDVAVEARGKARMLRRGERLFADWLQYNRGDDEVYAVGDVRFDQRGDTLEGPRLRLNLESRQGFIEAPTFSFSQQGGGGRGRAEQLNFEGPDLYRLSKVEYTTCTPAQDAWWVRSDDLQIDRVRDVGTARNARVDFMGVPILYSPYLDFALKQQRKTGFLTPTFATSGKSGQEFSLPWYWNIAPNRDATFTPHIMSKRGLLLHNEFRYLDAHYNGEARLELLPNDRVRGNEDRSAFFLRHNQVIDRTWTFLANVQRVSDDDYFRDLSSQVTVTSLTTLPRDVLLARSGSWWNGGVWGLTAQVQRWQTLQDPLAPIVPPYNRQPQVTLTGLKQDIAGLDFSFIGNYVDFNHPTLANGRRVMAQPSVSLPLQTSAAYLTPRLGVNLTHYMMDRSTTTLADASRTVPMFSTEGGLVFERNATFGGERYLQTLEPKVYYVYIPTRDQSALPNFESGVQDINLATIFSENQFSGYDRINDANQITLGVGSRLLRPETGAEVLRAGLAQRYYFKNQEVTLPGVAARGTSSSDLLATLAGSVARNWIAELGWQYNTDFSQTQKLSAAARYAPEPGKVLNLAYRYTRDVLKQVDVSTQWPIRAGWTGVGRVNYSILENRVLDVLAGIEYDAGCWALRVVGKRLATGTQDYSTSVFVQLELNGVSKVGSNPLQTLKDNISGYSRANQPALAPVDAHYAR